MNVVWGSNSLRNCVALLSWKDEIVLSISGSPLRIDLRTPSSSNAKAKLRVDQNRVVESEPGDTKVVETTHAVAILKNGIPILMAQDAGNDEITLHTDLRPLGMNIFDDAAGLHIGGSTLANNSFAGLSTAISLG
jgi:hypothetical protein